MTDAGVGRPEQQQVPFASGMHVAPCPVTFVARSVQVPTPAGSTRMVVLHLEHTTGSTVLVLPTEFAKALAQGLLKEATGIEVASSPLVVPHG